uniref:Oxidoreductase-like domain-containing protein n=1 Tax=Strongyloides papillosus TaxID=174720 RepID=A0A0N5BAE1_STREA
MSLTTYSKGSIFPEAPGEGICCGSGCQNCVWLVYAEEVLRVIETHPDFSDKSNKKEIYRNIESQLKNEIQDPNLREFVLMDIRSKFRI